MSGSAEYFLVQPGEFGSTTEPVQDVSIEPASRDRPIGEVFLDGPNPIVLPEFGQITIEEFINGAETGSAILGGVVQAQSGMINGLYYSTGTLTNVTVTGQFDPLPCFATGTLIATTAGFTAVETLTAADEVILATGGTARVTWIGHRRQINGTVIRVRAHALGHQSPGRDLIVSADHGLYLDGVLVQAGLLVNGETILEEHRDAVVFWHVELEQHGILLAEGARAESYLDTGNRRQFGNCSLAYEPAAALEEPCAEMVFDQERIAPISAKLMARSLDLTAAKYARAAA